MPIETKELPCSEKLVFDDKKSAEASAVTIDWQRGIPLKAYKCQHCGLLHLSSK